MTYDSLFMKLDVVNATAQMTYRLPIMQSKEQRPFRLHTHVTPTIPTLEATDRTDEKTATINGGV
jgi:hypothetical protein